MKTHAFEGLTDGQIWDLFREGDVQAYEHMYARHFKMLYNYGRNLTKKEELVEDCIQELFFHLLTHKETLSPVSSIKYYLFRSLRRRIFQSVQREEKTRSQESWPDDYDFEVILSVEQRMELDTAAQERLQALAAGLNALPRRQREALFLIYYENLSYPEVADIMGLKIKTVYNLVHNAMVSLKKMLRHEVLALFYSLFMGLD